MQGGGRQRIRLGSLLEGKQQRDGGCQQSGNHKSVGARLDLLFGNDICKIKCDSVLLGLTLFPPLLFIWPSEFVSTAYERFKLPSSKKRRKPHHDTWVDKFIRCVVAPLDQR